MRLVSLLQGTDDKVAFISMHDVEEEALEYIKKPRWSPLQKAGIAAGIVILVNSLAILTVYAG
jgi:hypothetical protein|tara:strand:+ start:738 stop:926 length:189 start_codon:yes stop_codon:yes gene_type:complete